MKTVACRALLFLLSGCSVETIVAAHRSGKEDAGMMSADGGNQGCDEQADCAVNEYCARASCGEGRGQCELRAVSCDADNAPVCGCDGITYFNDCLRRAIGVDRAHDGVCGAGARTCGRPDDAACPAASYCARQAMPRLGCAPDVPGTCWVVPSICDLAPGPGDRFVSCMGGMPECMDICTAIQSEMPFERAQRCMPGR